LSEEFPENLDSDLRGLPESWRARLASGLEPGEVVLDWFEPDLEAGLRFGDGLVVLTDRRILAMHPGQADGQGDRWRSWPLAEVLSIRAGERSGLGRVELLGAKGRLEEWPYTVARATSAQRLARRFEELRRNGTAERPDAEARCPSCGAPLSPGQLDCPACAVKTTPVRATPAFGRLLGFARPRAAVIALGFALTVASTAAGLVPPYLTQPLVDDVLIPRQAGQPAPFDLIWWYVGLMLASSLLSWLLSWARSYVMAWVGERIAADLRDRTYRHLMRLSMEFFGGRRTGDLISRLGDDTDRINNFLSINLVDYATDVLMIIGTAVILFVKSPILALATLVPLPLAFWLVAQVRGRLRSGFEAGSRAWAAITSVLADTIPGIRVVKAFAQEGREIERFRRANERVVSIYNQVNATWAFFGPLLNLLTQSGLLIVWTVGAWLIFDGSMGVGLLTMFIAYLGRFYTRMESLSRMVQATQRAGASAQRVFEILDRVSSVPEPAQPVDPGQLRGAIELRDVSFRYGTREVLHEISLAIRPGEMIGLVGPTGAGKSTLINLICRFYDVHAGAILADGVDIRRFPVEAYRHNVGIVLQEPFLFYGTIAENIAYGKPDASRAEIIAAARAARAHEFILRLPDGYDTMVGERGQNLSGGERQRVSIARALLIDPAILILDEATSSVDIETEREIQAALENLIRGRTTIAIAHRLSTLRRADRVVVIEDGRIVEVGRHHDLLRTPEGAFARLHRSQLELAGAG
jgi:ATP-binding cassette subfamily B protein